MTETELKAPSLAGSALWYAARGVPVFRLQPGRKVPLPGSAGFKDATTDPDLIRRWWAELPEANIGLATGHAFDVVDVDGAPGQASRAAHWCYDEACRAAGSLPQPPADWTELCEHQGVFNKIEREALAKVSTPRPGGMHLYVPPTGDGNKAGILPGVDYRGLGGYVVAPPSVLGPLEAHPGTYAFLGTPRLEA